MEREHGSLIRAALRQGRAARPPRAGGRSGARYEPLQTLAEGMDTLPRTLAERAARGGAPARRRPSGGSPGPGPKATWRVELLDGPPIEADAVILAAEAHAAARLIDGHDPELALDLRSIPYASSAIVQLAYRRDRVAHPLDGFGVVVPAVEGRDDPGRLLHQRQVPEPGPGGHGPDAGLPRRGLAGRTCSTATTTSFGRSPAARLAGLLGATGEPCSAGSRGTRGRCRSTRSATSTAWPRSAAGAAAHPGLILAGNAYGGVGVPDCVRSGR